MSRALRVMQEKVPKAQMEPGKSAAKKRFATRAPLTRIPFLEGLRGLAALYVVLGHLCSMSDPSKLAGRTSAAPPWFQVLIAPFTYGHLAVAAFIVISGFCLQLALFAGGNGKIKSTSKFFWKRAKRILPAYYGCLLFSTLVAMNVTSHLRGMPFEMYLPVDTPTVLSHVFLVHNWSLNWMYKLNGVLWSIAIEAQLYIVFPLIVASLFRFGRWWTMVSATAIAYLVLRSDAGALKLYPWYLPLFVMGMISAHLAYQPNALVRTTLVPRTLGILALGATIYGVWSEWSLPATDACIGLWIACLCHFGAVGRPSPVTRLLSVKPLVALGGFSYSLYLIHHPIQQILYWYRPAFAESEVGKFEYFLLTLPLILVGAWAFSLVFERPFMSRKKVRKKGAGHASLPLVTASASKPEAPVLAREPGVSTITVVNPAQ